MPARRKPTPTAPAPTIKHQSGDWWTAITVMLVGLTVIGCAVYALISSWI